jgi:uncharacterized protein (TIGR03437 family)
MSIALSGFVRSVSQQLAPVLILMSAPGLMAQQYCFSGAVTSIQSCSSCSFQVGDPVAMTFAVQSGTASCAAGISCNADGTLSLSVGTTYWTSSGPSGQLGMTGSTVNIIEEAAYLSPAPAAPMAFSTVGVDLFLSIIPGNLLSSGTLPAMLPAPSSPPLVFHAIDQLGGGTLNFSYTGQTCAAPASSTPAITLVQNAEGGAAAIAPNTWVTLKGSNLAPAGDSRIWQASDFVNNQLPTQLDGVSVTLNNEKAFVYYISPTQINILTPPDLATGTVQVQAVTNAGTSASFTAQAQAESPSFFIFGGGPYVAATHGNGSLLGPTSLYPGQSTPANPGETIVLYANGFGPTQTPVVSGSETQSGSLNPLPVITIGKNPATVQFAGLISPGLYQFNVVVPASTPAGDNALTATYAGLTTQSGVLVTVGP